MKINTNSIFAIFVSILFLGNPGTTQAQDLPRFDGVYAVTSEGQFIELQRMTNLREVCRLDYTQPQEFSGPAYREYIDLVNSSPSSLDPRQFFIDNDQAAHLPVVWTGNLESIFIRSRSERLERVQFLTFAADYFRDVVGEFRIHVASGDNCYRSDWPVDTRIPNCLSWYPSWHQSLPGECLTNNPQVGNFLPYEDTLLSGLVVDDCGWSAEAFRILNESSNTFQYFPRHGELTQLGRIPLSVRFGGCGSNEQDRPLRVGTVIETNIATYILIHHQLRSIRYRQEQAASELLNRFTLENPFFQPVEAE